MCEKLLPSQWWSKRKQMMNDYGSEGETALKLTEHWASLGLKKEYNARGIKFSFFTPLNNANGSLCPVLFVMHMGGDDIFSAEWFGFLEQAAKRGYIVAIPAWRDGPDESLAQEWEESGLTREGFVFSWVLEELRKKKLPLDESRIYVAGMSGGGNAAAFIAQAFPELIAAFSPPSGAALQGAGVATGGTEAENPLTHMEQLGMGMIMPYGLDDKECRWPISDKLVEMGPANHLPVEQRLEQVNRWLKACGTDTTTSAGDMKRNMESDEDRATVLFGLNFDREYRMDLEVPYYFGDCLNRAGAVTARFVGISQCGHHFSESWAEIVCDFFDTCRRDPATRELIVEKK